MDLSRCLEHGYFPGCLDRWFADPTTPRAVNPSQKCGNAKSRLDPSCCPLFAPHTMDKIVTPVLDDWSANDDSPVKGWTKPWPPKKLAGA